MPARRRGALPRRLPGGRHPLDEAHQGHLRHGAVRDRARTLPLPLRGGSLMPVDARRVDNDARLVDALRREDPDAPEHLVETFGDRVYRLALRITGSNEDAEEAAQDALWAAARKIHTFKGEAAFGGRVYRIAADAAHQKLRARRAKAAADALDHG